VGPATAEIYDSGGFTVPALASRSNAPREESMAIPLSGKAPLNRQMTPHDGTRAANDAISRVVRRTLNEIVKKLSPRSQVSFNVLFIVREIDCVFVQTALFHFTSSSGTKSREISSFAYKSTMTAKNLANCRS